MAIDPFSFSGTPRIVFGAKGFSKLTEIIQTYGRSALIVTGSASFLRSGRAEQLFSSLERRQISFNHCTVSEEPSPDLIDDTVSRFRSVSIDIIVGIGGGSVIDAGKAISAMLLVEGSVKDYIEGIGTRTHNGAKVPYIAVPTTAGTGSEATKNAVLSSVERDGYKKSLRHDNFVPDTALVDPELTLTCPPDITAACGIDALCQLIESYVSTRANPMTDTLALNGIHYATGSLIDICTTDADNMNKRGMMSYAALISGITLAQAGLAWIHGMAGPIGGFFRVPHGIACGTLLAATLAKVVARLKHDRSSAALKKLADIGRIMARDSENDDLYLCKYLVATLYEWTGRLSIPRLGEFGVTKDDIPKILRASDNKNSPVELSPEEMSEVLAERI